MSFLRILLLTVLIGAMSWFQFVNTASAREVTRNAVDLFDPRPGQDILFIGNSRLFTNDLPSMVRAVADSADAPVKYRVQMWALPGLRFEDHARNKTVQRLLAQRWDRVVLQAQSAESMMGEEWRASFAANGRRLVGRARAAGSPASLVVNWTYSEEEFRRHEAPEGERARVYGQIQNDHRALAGATGADLINVGAAFRRVETAEPAIDLIPDGNHPSQQGTYVYALMVYAHLSGADVRTVRFVPEGVSEDEARRLRELVADHLASAVDA
jgi:uncharacterized protein DUF4886